MATSRQLNILIVAGSRGSISQLRPEYESFIRMAEHGHNVTVVIKPDSVYVPRLQEAGIRMLNCYPEKKIDIRSIRALRKELQTHTYDIIYATTSKTIPNAAFAAVGFPAKLIAYRGTTGGLYRHDPTAYLTILHPRVDGVICVSDAVRQDVLMRVWKNQDKVVTIHKGHDLSWYKAQPSDLGQFGIKPDDFTAICAVNVRKSKGIDILLRATESLAHLDKLHLLLAGKGMDSEPYAGLIQLSPMRERIHIVGFRNDAPELIAASDVLVQPSRSGEGLPRAVMEALGYGTPVIITDTGGGKEVVQDGVSGFIVAVEDPAAIADRIEQLYFDDQLASSMSAEAKKLIATQFSSARTTEQMLSYFAKIVS